MSTESNGGTSSALEVVEAAFTELGWNKTPIHMLRWRLDTLERERDGWRTQYQSFADHASARGEIGFWGWIRGRF